MCDNVGALYANVELFDYGEVAGWKPVIADSTGFTLMTIDLRLTNYTDNFSFIHTENHVSAFTDLTRHSLFCVNEILLVTKVEHAL